MSGVLWLRRRRICRYGQLDACPFPRHSRRMHLGVGGCFCCMAFWRLKMMGVVFPAYQGVTIVQKFAALAHRSLAVAK